MADQSGSNSSTVNVDVTEEGRSGSRRGFLQLGAVVVAGLVDGCSPADGGDDGNGAGGKTGNGGTTGSGGASGASSGGATYGGASSGGASSGGHSNGSGGTTSAGGTTSSAGGTTSSAGTTSVAGTTSGGGTTAAGGSPATGGGSPGGAGGGGGNPDPTTWVENRGSKCSVGTPPTFDTAMTNAKLPDPFKFINGMRISKKEDWACLRADLSAMAQACIYGPKMPPPDKLTASFSGGTVTVNMTVGSKTAMFTFKISGGGSMSAPVPVLITCGGSSLPKMSGVAQIDMANNSFASEMDLSGIVKNLYGNTAAKSGALIGWAWGCSRIIDALQALPEAGCDTKRIAVTGCSRNGKGALAMGAFDERVALTIPQEGGSGGPAVWRVSQTEKSMGQNIQESNEIVGEAKWQGSDFASYAKNLAGNNKLPADQHTVIALCAPRAVLVIDNDIDWLGPVACYAGGHTAAKLYQGLGIADRCGVSIAANHNHCQFPSAQQAILDKFVNRFLKNMKVDTSGVDELHATNSKLGKFDEATWIDWDVPMLSGNLAWDPFA